MGDGDHNNDLTLPRLFVLLSGIASAAVVVAIYHCIAVGWCNRRRSQQQEEHDLEMPSSGLDNSQVNLIPKYRYDKEFGLVGEDGSCSVCLSEFQEGEELRTLPECMHSFHVSCIDMWLYSHTSCPLCRADTTPSPLIRSSMMNSSGTGVLEVPPDIGRRTDSS